MPSPSPSQPLTHDLDCMTGEGEGEGPDFCAFSHPPAHSLRALFTAGVGHSIRRLALSTVRLTADACGLLSSLLFLSHLELRLFESIAEEWFTDFLLTPQPSTAQVGMDAVFLRGAGLFSDCPSLSLHSQSQRAAVRACARVLQGSVRRLCHLQSLTVVDYVDEADSDDWPNLSAQSEAVISAVQGHPHLERLQLRRPRFSASPLFDSTLTAGRLQGIPHLRAVEMLEVEGMPSARCHALTQCRQLTELRISHSERETASCPLFNPALFVHLPISWPHLHTLIIDAIPVGDSPSPFLSFPSSPSSSSTSPSPLVRSSPCDEVDCPVTVDVSSYFASLSAFFSLTTLRLSFSPRASTCSAPIQLTVTPQVWKRCWDPTLSPLARSVVHLTVPAVSCPIASVLTLPCLRTLRVRGNGGEDVLVGLREELPGKCGLRELRVGIRRGEVRECQEWASGLTGVGRRGLVELEEFEAFDCADESQVLVQWKVAGATTCKDR